MCFSRDVGNCRTLISIFPSLIGHVQARKRNKNMGSPVSEITDADREPG
jgi:hypothetical protein